MPDVRTYNTISSKFPTGNLTKLLNIATVSFTKVTAERMMMMMMQRDRKTPHEIPAV